MFVQIITGTTRDAEAFDRQGARWNTELRPGATGFLGSTVYFADDTFVELASFTDESAARSGESSDDFAGPQQEYAALFTDLAYVGLRNPRLAGPAGAR